MSRNYKKEVNWSKEKYDRFEVRIPKSYKFKEYLEKNNLKFAEWCKNKVIEELSKSEVNSMEY